VKDRQMAGTQKNSERKKPMITLTLTPEAIDRLEQIAERWGTTRSGAVERMIRETDMPRSRT
jgi:hypothetical protein